MIHEFWTVAYRKREGNTTILDNRETPFHAIPNSWRYWYADPHFFKDENGTWIFAEACDLVLRRGVVSCCRIREDGSVTPWKVVLKLPYHLSYPHVFEKNGSVYMIPESYIADETALFETKDFPGHWEKTAVLRRGGSPVDSTVFSFGGKEWMFSMLLANGKEKLMLYPLEDGKAVGEGIYAQSDDLNARPAGKLFYVGDKLIRPAQDCTESYGCALNFYEVKEVSSNQYSETLIAKIHPKDVPSDLAWVPQGIHTYNLTDEYEVVDFKEYRKDPLFTIMRPVWGVWRRVKKAVKLLVK